MGNVFENLPDGEMTEVKITFKVDTKISVEEINESFEDFYRVAESIIDDLSYKKNIKKIEWDLKLSPSD